MKKIKYSVVEKKLIRNVFISVLIQVLIIAMFFMVFNASQPIDINDTIQTEITVDDTYYLTKGRMSNWLIITENSTNYIFDNHNKAFEKNSVRVLNESINVGDRLSLRYHETFSFLGKIKFIVAAQTDTEIYRTFEEYNKSKQGVDTAVIVIFSVFELLFCAYVFISFTLDKNTIKSIYRKVKKVMKK